MHCTSVACELDRAGILAFLDGDNLGMNVWLVQSVCSALDWPTDYIRVFICREADVIAGVAAVSGSPETKFSTSYRVTMDATDHEAAAALMDALPENAAGRFHLFHPMLQKYLGDMPGSECSLADPYFTVSRERFRPVDADGVIEFTAADAHLFEGCERQLDWEHIGAENRVLGITLRGRVATSVGCSPVTPAMPSGRRVVAISGLHTETKHRRKGLARQLVSYATDVILRDGNIPCYWTEPENEASQALCLSLGYYQYAREMRYAWRKEHTP